MRDKGQGTEGLGEGGGRSPSARSHGQARVTHVSLQRTQVLLVRVTQLAAVYLDGGLWHEDPGVGAPTLSPRALPTSPHSPG